MACQGSRSVDVSGKRPGRFNSSSESSCVSKFSSSWRVVYIKSISSFFFIRLLPFVLIHEIQVVVNPVVLKEI